MEKGGKHLLALKDSSHTHTSTNAHGGDTDLLTLALELGEEGSDLAGTGAAERVTEGDGTTLGVDLLDGGTDLLDGVDGLGGEGLVDLKDVNIVDGQASALDGDGDGEGRTDTHDARGHTDDGGGDVFAEDLEAELLGGLALHEQDGSSTVRDLGGVTGGGGALIIESGAQLAELLGGGARADTIVTVDDDGLLVTVLVGDDGLKRDDLLLEPAVLLSLDGLGVRRSGKGILLLTRDLELGSDVLGGDTDLKKFRIRISHHAFSC